MYVHGICRLLRSMNLNKTIIFFFFLCSLDVLCRIVKKFFFIRETKNNKENIEETESKRIFFFFYLSFESRQIHSQQNLYLKYHRPHGVLYTLAHSYLYTYMCCIFFFSIFSNVYMDVEKEKKNTDDNGDWVANICICMMKKLMQLYYMHMYI